MFSECNAVWPRRPERRELSVIKIRSSMPPAAYQRLDANPTIHMQMRFLGSTVGVGAGESRGCGVWLRGNALPRSGPRGYFVHFPQIEGSCALQSRVATALDRLS